MTDACAICGGSVRRQWEGPQTAGIPPLCYGCETSWGNPPRGWLGQGDKVKLMRGAYRDRRLAVQIFALAEAISAEANMRIYNGS